MTSLWTLYAVIFSQVVVLFGVAAPATFRLLQRSYLNKNAAWLGDHPEFVARYGQVRYPARLSYLLGALWLLFLALVIAGGQMAEHLTAALLAPAFCWMALEATVAAIEYRRVALKIPLPAVRRATLEPRGLRDFASPAWIFPGYALLAGIMATYTVGYSHELVDGAVFAWRMASMVVGTGLWIVTLRYCVRRKRQLVDDTFGPGYRRLEVRGTIGCLYIFAGFALLRGLQELFGIYLLTDLTFLTLGSILLQTVLLSWVARLNASTTPPVST
jgi:hypothetical protein